MKLKEKLLSFFIALTIAPLMLMAVFTYHQYVRFIDLQLSFIARNQLGNMTVKIQNSYDAIWQALTYFSSPGEGSSVLSVLRQIDSSADPVDDFDVDMAAHHIQSSCHALTYRQPNVQKVCFYTLNHFVFGYSRTSGGISTVYDPTGEEWYQKTVELNGMFQITPPIPQRAGNVISSPS